MSSTSNRMVLIGVVTFAACALLGRGVLLESGKDEPETTIGNLHPPAGNNAEAGELANVTSATAPRQPVNAHTRDSKDPLNPVSAFAEPANPTETYKTLTSLRESVLTGTLEYQRADIIGLASLSIGTILSFEGRHDPVRDGKSMGFDDKKSMNRDHKDQNVVSVNGTIYRFDKSEFPHWEELVRFLRTTDSTAEIPEDLRERVIETVDYALGIEASR